MSNFLRTLSAATCMVIVLSQPAFGWGQTGHRITGAIAEHYLSPAAKAQIDALLPNQSLAEAATYADEMRSNPSEFWRKISPPWHYVTVPAGKRYREVGAPVQGDAYTALQQFTEVLKSAKTTTRDKQLALRFIVHIIGDLHQPLHAGNGTDRGGNDVKVNFFWEDTNLHRVWDSQLIAQQELSYSEWTAWLQAKISPQQISAWNTLQPEEWIKESAQIRESIYPKDDTPLNYQYAYQHLPTVKLRLKQAGVRMALYLNAIFAATTSAN